MDFKVESVAGGQKSVVFARQIGEGAFALSAAPTLSGAAIKKSYSKLNSTNNDGTPRPSLFAFQLVTATDIEKFHVGDKVTLG